MKLKFFQHLFNIVEQPVFVHDENFHLLLGNEAYYRVAGVKASQALGKVYWHVFPLGKGALSKCKAGIKKGQHDAREELKIGSAVYACKIYQMTGSLGQPLYVHVMKDITQDAQQKISEERYRRLFETAKDGILLLDADSGMVLDANPFMTEMTGYSLDVLLGKHIWELGFLNNIAENKDKFLELQQKKYVRYENLPLETIKGKRQHVEFVSNFYSVGDTNIIQCNIRDISRRVKAEENNKHLQQMYLTVSHCNKALVRAQSEFELCNKICSILHTVGGFPVVAVIYMLSRLRSGSFKQFAGAGDTEGKLKEFHLPTLNKAIEPATAIQIEQAIAHAPQVFMDRRSASNLSSHKGEHRGDSLAMVAIPFKIDSKNLGALVIYADDAHYFSEDVIGLLKELAEDLAFGISHIRSNAERIATLEKLEASLDHAVTAIAATVEMRDPYTAGHQRHVAKLALAIAAELGLSEDQMQGLGMACMVHDIGKIHVPAEILVNPGKLTDAEFEIIKTHPQIGWSILKEIDFPWPVAEIVYQHHERLDGSGYPRGLKGDAILLETRILMVADVLEAMSSHRPYRPSHGVFVALQEITQHKGKLYDPKVVDACLRLFLEQNYQMNNDESKS